MLFIIIDIIALFRRGRSGGSGRLMLYLARPWGLAFVLVSIPAALGRATFEGNPSWYIYAHL